MFSKMIAPLPSRSLPPASGSCTQESILYKKYKDNTTAGANAPLPPLFEMQYVWANRKKEGGLMIYQRMKKQFLDVGVVFA